MTLMEKDEDLQLLLNEVLKERGLDFSQYRENLIERRIAVRLRATKCRSYDEYARYLYGNRAEMDALLDALTINVSHFFRDKKVFDAVGSKVIPELFPAKTLENKKLVRIWSCGSSEGEEATTVLILIAEYLREKLDRPVIHIYGTDIDGESLDKARNGVYEENEFREMPGGLREKYFLKADNKRFQRKKELDKYLFFKKHDIIKDEPIRGVDLVLCRNLFIYFKRELQELCLEKFARALNENGFLVLGATESLWGAMGKSFSGFDREARIYRKV